MSFLLSSGTDGALTRDKCSDIFDEIFDGVDSFEGFTYKDLYDLRTELSYILTQEQVEKILEILDRFHENNDWQEIAEGFVNKKKTFMIEVLID